jgi:multidrug efflux system membrane fusion protein
MRELRVLAAAAFAGLLLLAAGCSRTASQAPPANPGVPVTVAKATQKIVPMEIHAIGMGEPYSTVSIKSQVNGQVESVHFKQGQFVKKGDLLFTLDGRPFQAALDQSLGNLARDKAQAEIAAVQAQRYAKLFREGVVPKETADQNQANADATRAAVRADEAVVEYAKLELAYCTIASPIDGQTGSVLVYPGNLVKANDVPILVVINQVNPIYADFSIPEQNLGDVKKYMAEGKLRVEASLPNDPRHPELGTLSFVDNTVDNTTGTIKLKGTFVNTDRRLWPGQFVNVVLRLAEQSDAVVVPAQAVQTGQNGQYVFVVKPDMTVESRAVVISRTVNADAVVEKGITPGETVVTDGQLRLVPGVKVQVKSEVGS